MRDDDAFRFAGRPRREDDLGDRVRAHVGASEVCARLGRCAMLASCCESIQRISRRRHTNIDEGSCSTSQPIADEDAAWRRRLDDAPHQFGRSRSIDRDDGDTAQHAAPERCDPLGPAVAPDQQPIAGRSPASASRPANASAVARKSSPEYDHRRNPSS